MRCSVAGVEMHRSGRNNAQKNLWPRCSIFTQTGKTSINPDFCCCELLQVASPPPSAPHQYRSYSFATEIAYKSDVMRVAARLGLIVDTCFKFSVDEF